MLADPLDPIVVDTLVDALARDGWGYLEAALPAVMVADLREACRRRETSGDMATAGIGRERQQAIATRVRRVDAVWLDPTDAAEGAFLALADRIRLAINRRLFLGLFEYEAQFLSYPPGGFYKRHLDALRGARNRIVSMVVYLNEAWSPEHGGELEVWRSPDDHGPPATVIAPRAGTVVLMMSEEIPHAVRISHAQRRVIAGWYRLNASSGLRVDPAA